MARPSDHPHVFLERAFDQSTDAVAAFDHELRFTFWNEPMEAVSRVSRRVAVGRTAAELFPAICDNGTDAELRAALDGSQRFATTPFFAAPHERGARAYEWFVMPVAGKSGVREGAAVARAARAGTEPGLHDAQFRTMADCSPVLLWMSEADSLCTFFNQTWLDFSGRTLEQEYGVGWIEGVHPEDFEHCMNTYMRAFSAQQPFEMEYRLRRADGVYRWLLDRGTPRHTGAGAFAGFIGSCVDITDRRDAEDCARRVAADLERAHGDMERLLYAASHDLREPIRMVTSFLGLLEGKCGEQLSEDARTYVGFAADGAHRMREMVDGLLTFARLRHKVQERVAVPLDDVILQVLDDLRIAIRDADAVIDVAPLPVVMGDAPRLRQVFQNLLSNAIKFRGDAPVRVEITAQKLDESWEISIVDNGVGFEQRFADRAFQMFQRLHSRERFHGSGIGLAIVNEIVDAHGGRVAVTSAPNEGATFRVLLPIFPSDVLPGEDAR